jgi:hypothetical protein
MSERTAGQGSRTVVRMTDRTPEKPARFAAIFRAVRESVVARRLAGSGQMPLMPLS